MKTETKLWIAVAVLTVVLLPLLYQWATSVNRTGTLVSGSSPLPTSEKPATPAKTQPQPSTPAPAAIPRDEAPPQQYSWVETKRETFVLDSGAGQAAMIKSGSRFHYAVKSTQPVNIGVVPIAASKAYADASGLSAVTMFNNPNAQVLFDCVNIRALEADSECPVDLRPTMMMVQDTRHPGNVPLAAIGAGMGVKGPLKNAVDQNRITLIIYEWMPVGETPQPKVKLSMWLPAERQQ